MTELTLLNDAERRGRAEGIAEGIAREKAAIAKELKVDGMSAEKIKKITGLSVEEIEKL
jgi:predicted transposase/invertase (TIGR01784 family)